MCACVCVWACVRIYIYLLLSYVTLFRGFLSLYINDLRGVTVINQYLTNTSILSLIISMLQTSFCNA